MRWTILLRLFVARLDCVHCCAMSCKSRPLKPEKPSNWVVPFFLSPTTSSGATRGRRKILNPPRSLRIWREPVRKQRRGVDYDDRRNSVRGCSCSSEWAGGFPECIAHPSVTHNRGSFLPVLPQLCADRQISPLSPLLGLGLRGFCTAFVPVELISPLSSYAVR